MTIPLRSAGPTGPDGDPQQTFYEAVGGRPTFVALVDRFYEGVVTDPLLRPMYPEAEIDPTMPGARERLTMFLEQFWGGPKTYGERRGHPRLRIRHAPFAVSPAARDAWLSHMRTAVDSLDLPPLQAETLWDYLERAAHSLVNTVDGGQAPLAGQDVPDRLE